jgi:hypothetical protein
MKIIASALAVLLLALVAAPSAVDATDAKGRRKLKHRSERKNNEAKAGEIVDEERDLKRRKKRKKKTVEDDPSQVYSRSYLAITKAADFVFVTPTRILTDNSDNENNDSVIGSSIVQSGGIYDFNDIDFVSRTSNDKDPRTPKNKQYAGKDSLQPTFIPQKDPGYFLDGECRATRGNGRKAIKAHSCLLNLCLGGGGYNCIALYAGTKFNFSPQTSGNRPPLPPSYPTTIIGGTGTFLGVKGTVDITTITGSTTILQGQQGGVISQGLNVVCNKPLPPAP